MIGDVGEHVAQISLGINGIQFSSADEAVDGGGPLAPRVGPGKQVVLPSQRYGPQCAFGSVVVHFDLSVVAITQQRSPAREPIADGDCGIGFP